MRVLGRGSGLLWLALAGGVASGCGAPVRDEVEVVVTRVSIDPAANAPVVLLEDRAHTVTLPIWVGAAEARAIAMRLEGIDPPRPLTHDLMTDVLREVDVELERVTISGLDENTYLAHLDLRSDGREIRVDSRPSDAIALALRFERPIFVVASLLRGENAVSRRDGGRSAITLAGVTVQVLSMELAEHFRLPGGRGVLVSESRHGPLERGDVVLEIDGQDVLGPEDFRSRVVALERRADLLVHRDGTRVHVFLEPAVAE